MARTAKKDPPQIEGRLRQVIDPAIAKALSHPLRSHILVTLGDRIASPKEIAGELGLAARDLDYHVKVLVELGMIRLVRTEQRRGATEHFYELQGPILYIDRDNWEAMPEPLRGRFSASLLKVVVDEAVAALEAGTFTARDSHQSRTPLMLDERGWSEVTEVMGGALAQVVAIGEKCAQALRQSGSEGIPIEVFMMGFETASGASRERARLAPQ
jgi:DNA-binding transcriptional ArsR family regulator